MRTLYIRNPDLARMEKTFLTAAYSSGVALSVINSFAFAANDIGCVGQSGEEKTELKKIDSITSDTALALASALKFSHPKDTVIYKSPWDNVEVSSKTTGAWSVLSTSGLQYDKPYTIYIHSTGDSTYSYRWRFYNSVTGTYSEYSPTYAGGGFTKDQAGYMIRNIRKITRTEGNEDVISDREIYRLINQAHDIIGGIRKDWWFLKFDDNSITTTASTFHYNLDLINGGSAGSPGTALGFINKVRYRYNDGGSIDTTYPLKFRSEAEFDMLITDNLRQNDDYVNIYTIRPADSSSDNGYIDVYPTPNTTGRGTFYISAFKQFATVDDDIDTTPIPVPGIIENFVIAFIERVRGNDTKADYYEQLFYGPPPEGESRGRLTGIALLEQLQNKSTPVGQPKSLVRFRGQQAINRYYGNRTLYNDRDYRKENFWD